MTGCRAVATVALVGSDHELREELVGQRVKVITVKLALASRSQVGVCESC